MKYEHVNPSNKQAINIMSQYNAQCTRIRKALKEKKYININVNTVVASQGRYNLMASCGSIFLKLKKTGKSFTFKYNMYQTKALVYAGSRYLVSLNQNISSSLEWLVLWITLPRVLADVDFGRILSLHFLINGVYIYGTDVFLLLVDKNGNNAF